MDNSTRHEFKQNKPFVSTEVEAVVNLARTAGICEREVEDLIKPYGITHTQYNVLRILRGAGEKGLCRFEVINRLIAPDPDVTRLLDRLEKNGLIRRTRDENNRRLVIARITDAGLRLLEQLDEPLLALHRKQLGHLGEERLHQLIDLLVEARKRT